MKRLFSGFCLVSIALIAYMAGPSPYAAAPVLAQVPAATPPPPPPPLPRETSPVTVPLTPVKPTPSGSPQPLATATAAASAAPAGSRKELDGVWEVQVQRRDDTSYAHFNLVQKASALVGTYVRDGKSAPLAGTIDLKSVRIVVTNADGSTVSFNATVDGMTDMVGTMQSGNESVPFTAAYRPKVKFMERAITGH